jgi:ribosomal protein S18 acetylase RimI-like enzyme
MHDHLTEGLRDKMTPRSEEDIKKNVLHLNPDNKIMKGIQQNIPYLVQLGIDEGGDVNKKYTNDTTPLQSAIYHHEIFHNNNSIEIVEMLLRGGSDTSLENPHYRTSVELCSTKKLYDVLKLIWKYNGVGESVRDHMTPKSEDRIREDLQKEPVQNQFIKACNVGYLDVVKKTLPYVKDSKNYLPLVYMGIRKSVENGHLNVLRYVIDNTELNYLHHNNEELLRSAATNGYTEIVDYLLDKGAYIHIQEDDPLFQAIYFGHVECAKLLLDRGAKLEKNFIRKDLSPQMKRFLNRYTKKMNESLQDGLTMKPIEHIESVGTYHRYNFIEDWADSAKYGKEVGYIVIDNECDLFLSSFTIWGPYKGKGLGRKYLNRILDELSKFKEYPWVALTVTRDNEIAIKLYRSVGFRDVNDVEEYEGPGKNYKNDKYYYMVKENK